MLKNKVNVQTMRCKVTLLTMKMIFLTLKKVNTYDNTNEADNSDEGKQGDTSENGEKTWKSKAIPVLLTMLLALKNKVTILTLKLIFQTRKTR